MSPKNLTAAEYERTAQTLGCVQDQSLALPGSIRRSLIWDVLETIVVELPLVSNLANTVHSIA